MWIESSLIFASVNFHDSGTLPRKREQAVNFNSFAQHTTTAKIKLSAKFYYFSFQLIINNFSDHHSKHTCENFRVISFYDV